MMRKEIVSVIYILVLGLGASSAIAGSYGHGKVMRHFDTNRDDIVTQEEFDQVLTQRFKKMDIDDNGTVSRDEFRQYTQKRRTDRKNRHYKAIDTNGDGQITKEEYLQDKRNSAEHHYAKMDKDGNGVVSIQEFTQRKFKGRHHRHHGKRVFHKLDANNDGKITQQESLAIWAHWFERLDRNTDSVVTKDEIDTAYQAHMN